MDFSDIRTIIIGEAGEYGKRLVRYLEIHLSSAVRVYHFTTAEGMVSFKEEAEIYLLDERFFKELSEEKQKFLKQKKLILLTWREEQGSFCKYDNPQKLLDMLSDFTDYNSDLSDLAAELKDTPTKLTIVYSPVYDEYLEQIARSFMSLGDVYMGAEDLGYKGIDSEYGEGGDMGDLCYYIHLREENILDILQDMKSDEKAASEEIEPVSEETLKERSNWKEIKETLQLLMRTGILFYAAEHLENLSRQSIPGTNLPSKRVKSSSFDNEQRLLDKMDELSFSSLKGIKSLLSVDISMDGRGTLWTKDRYIISYIEDCFSFYGSSDKKDNALLYEVEYLISGKNSDIDNLKRVANYILLLRFINNYIFTGKDTQMKMQINTMASAITGVMGMPQTMKAVQVLIRMAISYGESLLELHTLFSGGEVPLIKDKTTWNLTLKTMGEQLRNKQIVKKGKKNISYKDYLKLFLLTKGNSRTVCYRMMDIMQENIASKEPGFLMENCLFSYSWKGSLAAGGVKLNFVKQCSY